MKISKNKLIETKFVVPVDKVDEFEKDIDPEVDDDTVIQVVDENKFVVPSEKLKDFKQNMGDNLDTEDTVQVYDEKKPDAAKKIMTKEGLVRTIKESLKNKLK